MKKKFLLIILVVLSLSNLGNALTIQCVFSGRIQTSLRNIKSESDNNFLPPTDIWFLPNHHVYVGDAIIVASAFNDSMQKSSRIKITVKNPESYELVLKQKEIVATIENEETHEILGHFVKNLPDQDAGSVKAYKTVNFYYKDETQVQECRTW